MTLLWFMVIPGVACLLIAVVTADRLSLWATRKGWIRWRRLDRPHSVSAAGLGAFDSALSEGARLEQDERQGRLLVRDEDLDDDTRPRRGDIDLDLRVARIRLG